MLFSPLKIEALLNLETPVRNANFKYVSLSFIVEYTIYEGFYASVIYTYLQALGIEIIGDDVTNQGRIDLTCFIEDKIYIIEFKTTDEDPLAQIHKNKYERNIKTIIMRFSKLCYKSISIKKFC
jgi:hypothetical protein